MVFISCFIAIKTTEKRYRNKYHLDYNANNKKKSGMRILLFFCLLIFTSCNNTSNEKDELKTELVRLDQQMRGSRNDEFLFFLEDGHFISYDKKQKRKRKLQKIFF